MGCESSGVSAVCSCSSHCCKIWNCPAKYPAGRGQCPGVWSYVTSDLSDDNVKAKTLSALSCHLGLKLIMTCNTQGLWWTPFSNCRILIFFSQAQSKKLNKTMDCKTFSTYNCRLSPATYPSLLRSPGQPSPGSSASLSWWQSWWHPPGLILFRRAYLVMMSR